ncbi:MAG: restriction endonuclease subunit S [Nitrospirales bacterium]|nr:restriction endonuclease subunit S [Nitrospirales bacterium]
MPTKWEWVSLGSICKTTSGGTPSRKNKEYFKGNIPWVKSGELPDGPISKIEEYITAEAVKNSNAKKFPKGTLLIALYGATVGKLGVLNKEAATNQAVCAIFPPEQLKTKYLFWYLRYVRSDLIAQAIGGAQPNISQGILRNLLIPVAPPEEQKRIVAEIEKQFSRLDEAVANLKRIKANLKRYKAAVLKAAVEGKLTENWRKAHPDIEPAAKLLDRILTARRAQLIGKGSYKDPAPPDSSELPELPPNWIWATSMQIFMEVKDGTHNTPQYRQTGVPFITQKHIKPGGLVFEDFKLISEADHEQFYKRSNPESGDILVSMIGVNRGQSCVVNTDATFSIKNVGLFKPNHLLTNNKFLQLYFSSFVGQRLILQRSKGGAQPFIGLSELRNWPLPLPPLAEQYLIVEEVERHISIIDELETTVEANLIRANRLRQSILSKAFAGGLKEN